MIFINLISKLVNNGVNYGTFPSYVVFEGWKSDRKASMVNSIISFIGWCGDSYMHLLLSLKKIPEPIGHDQHACKAQINHLLPKRVEAELNGQSQFSLTCFKTQ